MNGSVLLIEVRFGPDLEVDRNWHNIMNKVISFTPKWAERTITLKGQVEVIYRPYISSLCFVPP